MPRSQWVAASVATLVTALSASAASAADKAGHYLFAWSGAVGGGAEDFIAVIDADPQSPRYGQLITAAASGIKTQQVHHTEYWMPDSAQLFANDHMSGETVVFDLKNPLAPRVRAHFHDLAGFSHPHSFLRLPNGNVLASFQFEGAFTHAGMALHDPAAQPGAHGGLVEIDEDGRAIRRVSTADREFADDPLMAYSLLPLPDIDRVLVTNSGMRDIEANGHTVQVFRLSDLKLLKTVPLDRGPGRYGELNPEEVRLGPDGAAYVQTLGCGIQRMSELTTERPVARQVYQFPGYLCGVPSVVGRYWIQPVQLLHAVVVVDLIAPGGPKEVSRVVFEGGILPHWSGYDARTHRLAVSGYGESRFYLLRFNPENGMVAIDRTFHDAKGEPGFDTGAQKWPHGWTGSAQVHGIVFSK